MQPPNPKETTNRTVFNASGHLNMKKRRGDLKKEKMVNEQQVKRDAVTPRETTTRSEGAIVATISSPFVSVTTQSPGPYRGKCLYQSRKCENERAVKRNGQPHNLCEGHRSKQNQHQRKFDAKKFLWKRQRESGSDEDTKIDGDKVQAHGTDDEPLLKRYRAVTNQEAETGTPTRMTNSQRKTPVLIAMKANYHQTYAAGFTPMSASVTRLPLIQTPRQPALPTTPDILYGSARLGITPEACLRGHVGLSGWRPKAGGEQQSSRVSLHRPSLQPQATLRRLGYTHSELLAASILAQPQQPHTLCATLSTPLSHKNGSFAAGPGAVSTTRMLPSLLIPPSAALSSSPYHRASGLLSSPAQRFASVAVNPVTSVSICSARVEGKALPPLLSFGRRKSPVSPLPVSKHSKLEN